MLTPATDPTTLTAPLSLSTFKAVLESLRPITGYGLYYTGNSNPGVVAPYTQCIWHNSVDHQLYRWDSGSTSWVPFALVVTLPDSSVTVGKLSITGSTADNQVICRYSGVPAWKSIVDLLATGVVPLSKLVPPGTADNYLPWFDGTTISWKLYSEIRDLVVAAVPAELTSRSVTAQHQKWNSALYAAGTWSSGDGWYNVVVGTGDAWTPGTITDGAVLLLLKVNASGSGTAQCKINGSAVITIKKHDGTTLLASDISASVYHPLIFDGTSLRMLNPIYTIPLKNASSLYPWETTTFPATITWAHGLGGVPYHVACTVKVVTAMTGSGDWALNDRFPISNIFRTDRLDEWHNMWWDETNVYLRIYGKPSTFSLDIRMCKKADGVDFALSDTNATELQFFFTAYR